MIINSMYCSTVVFLRHTSLPYTRTNTMHADLCRSPQLVPHVFQSHALNSIIDVEVGAVGCYGTAALLSPHRTRSFLCYYYIITEYSCVRSEGRRSLLPFGDYSCYFFIPRTDELDHTYYTYQVLYISYRPYRSYISSRSQLAVIRCCAGSV